MPEFRVTWEVDIDADNPREAAEKALEIQRRVGSSAVVFDVFDQDGESLKIDLDNLCRTDGCSGDPDDGEGWDGYCGNCADRLDAKEDDEPSPCRQHKDTGRGVCCYCGVAI